MAPRGRFVALVLCGCAAGALLGFLQPALADKPVALRVRELVRVRGGQPVLVLQEIDGQRVLPVPLTRSEAALLEHGDSKLGARTVEALGGRVLGACIDEVSAHRGFRAHLSLGSGARKLQVDATAGEALTLALQAGARIEADPSVLDEAAVTPEDLHGRAAREITRDSAPAPVLHI
jgi:bifunctional DNase/RNase